MHVAALVLSVLLALGMLMSGLLKIRRSERIVRLMAAVGVTGRSLTLLGGLQVASTVGLLAGLWFLPLALAAAGGLVLYFAGAVVAHLRVGDRDVQGAAGFLVISAVTLTLLAIAG